ncbi:MAG: hypothetical protein GQ574_13905 [Crocinitomix sp.]|nr:hypothetical protein [Crocinitomix sp.]
MKLFITYIFLLAASTGFAKGIEVDTFLVRMEAEINQQLEIVRAAKDDNQRYLENESLKDLVESILARPGSLTYPFASFQSMSTISSPDGAFRIFNWNIEDNVGLNSHYCYMILPSRGEKPNQVIEFKEDKVTIPPRPANMLTPNNWYGALYYKIIPVRKGSKTMYTMIGYNGAGRSTNRKMLDVFYFKGKKLRMGYPIFQESETSSRLVRRVFFEHSEKAKISVNMNTQLDAIVFDHLVPETADLKGMYEFYVPDMTYDAYRWEGDIWRYNVDLIATNQENKKTRVYNPKFETDTTGKEKEFIDLNDKWTDPVDGNPNGGGTNAIAPLEDDVELKGREKRKAKSKDKKHRKGWFKRRNEPRSAVKND